MEGIGTQTRKWEGAGESSRVREVCGEGLTEGGMKERGPDGSEQESKAKYLIGIKCPDSVRGRLNSTKRAAFSTRKGEAFELKPARGEILFYFLFFQKLEETLASE